MASHGINNGKGGTVAWITVCALLSIALVENVPGFVVAPVFGKLSHVLPGGASESSVQMLAIVPNVILIPFMLLSGWLTGHLGIRKRPLLVIGLSLFAGSTVIYVVAKSMAALMWASVILGVGTGLMLPLDTALIADLFKGRQRTRMMGWAVGLSTFMMVPLTYAVGWLGQMSNWHMPFVVYFIALIPLIMSPWVQETDFRAEVKAVRAKDPAVVKGPGYNKRLLWHIIIVYFVITLGSMVASFYLPFLMADRKMSTTGVGTALAAFYLVRFGVGILLPRVIYWCRGWATQISMGLIIVGLIFMALGTHELWIIVGAVFLGLGYGVYQPLLFDLAPEAVNRPSLVTMAVSIMLVADCSAYTAAPYALDWLTRLCGFHSHVMGNIFPILCVIALIGGLLYYAIKHPKETVFTT